MPENAKAVLADRAEVSWDTNKNKWLVRIQSGEEVIRRHCGLPKGADDQGHEERVGRGEVRRRSRLAVEGIGELSVEGEISCDVRTFEAGPKTAACKVEGNLKHDPGECGDEENRAGGERLRRQRRPTPRAPRPS